MKNFITTLLIALTVLCIRAQPTMIWQKSLGGTGVDEYAYSIRQTTDGGYIVTGSSTSNDGDVSGNHGGKDCWVARLNDVGALQWQKSLGGTNNDYGLSVQQTTDGGYIVAGYSRSNDGDVSGNHGGDDCWIARLDATGTLQWQKCLGGTGSDYFRFIQQTTDGGYIVAGSSASNDGDVSGSHGDYECWVVKLNAGGSLQWQQCLGGTGVDEGCSVQQTTDGGYIVAGFSESNDGLVSGNHGGYDYWVVKLNAGGSLQWQKSLGGTGSDYAYSVQQTADGGYVVAGRSQSNNGDVTGNHGDDDYWVVKLNTSGSLQWQKSLGGTGSDYGRYIQQTTDGGYIVAGFSDSNNGDVSGNHSSPDYWVVKLNASSTLQWQKSLGGSGVDDAYSIQQTADGNYVVAGRSQSNNGDVSGNHGGYDYWVVKLGCTPTRSTQIQIACGSYTWVDGHTYTASTTTPTYNIAGGSANGCDSIITLNLTIKQPTAGSVSAAICQGQSYMFNGIARTVGGSYLDTLVNSAGCDSIVTLNLTVKQPTAGSVSAAICQGQSYMFNGIARTVSGSYLDTLVNSAGCDSIVTLNLTVKQPTAGSVSAAICHGQSYMFNGIARTVSGSYLDTLVNSAGCDSIVTLNLTVKQPTAGSVSAAICQGQSYMFNGIVRTVSGSYLDTLVNSAGCDSIITLNLTVKQATAGSVSAAICQGQSYMFNGIARTVSGSYLDTLVNSAGCDSIVTLNLTVKQPTAGSVSAAICQGQSYMFNGVARTVSGSYLDTLVNSAGCDSIVTLNLTVSNVLTGNFTHAICAGESYTFNNVQLTQAGNYSDTLQSGGGCDSIVTLTLLVNNLQQTSINGAICAGDTYSFNNSNLTQAGTYTDTLQSVAGCDSIVTLTLSVNALPAPIITGINNTLHTQTFASYEWLLNGHTTVGSDSILVATANGDYAVVVTDDSGCSDTSGVFSVTGVGMGEVVQDYSVAIFPNPNTGKFVVLFSDNYLHSVYITNTIGQIVFNNIEVKQKYTFDLAEEAPGIYFLHVLHEQQTNSFKISLFK